MIKQRYKVPWWAWILAALGDPSTAFLLAILIMVGLERWPTPWSSGEETLGKEVAAMQHYFRTDTFD